MHLLQNSCYINKDYITPLVSALDGMVLRKDDLKMSYLKQADKKITGEWKPNNFEILQFETIFEWHVCRMWAKSIMLKTDWCLFEMLWASKYINIPNAVFRLLQCKRFIVWITIPLGLTWNKTLKCFGKRYSFDQSNFLLPVWAAVPADFSFNSPLGLWLAANPFCVTLSHFLQYCSLWAFLSWLSCIKLLLWKVGMCHTAFSGSVYMVLMHISLNNFVSATIWQLKL